MQQRVHDTKMSSIHTCTIRLIYLYRKVSNIRRTKSQNLSDCRLILQLPLANPLKPGVKLRTKM